jgi:hypothetical protein
MKTGRRIIKAKNNIIYLIKIIGNLNVLIDSEKNINHIFHVYIYLLEI